MGLIIMHKAKNLLSGPEYLTLVLYKLGGGGCPGIMTQIQGFPSTCPGIGPL